MDWLDALAHELVADRLVLIAATGGMRSARAAKKATASIPIVFVLGSDRVQLGLVASFNRPNGDATGTMIVTTALAPKRLNLLYDLDPDILNFEILVNPASSGADVEIQEVTEAAGIADDHCSFSKRVPVAKSTWRSLRPSSGRWAPS